MIQGEGDQRLLSITSPEALRCVLRRLLEEKEFLSSHGIRAGSRYYKEHAYRLDWNNTQYQINCEPAESTTNQFGSNSNWSEPVWFPLTGAI